MHEVVDIDDPVAFMGIHQRFISTVRLGLQVQVKFRILQLSCLVCWCDGFIDQFSHADNRHQKQGILVHEHEYFDHMPVELLAVIAVVLFWLDFIRTLRPLASDRLQVTLLLFFALGFVLMANPGIHADAVRLRM